ncbi:cytochrome P450 [Mycobacterium sp. UM_CSW]|uniref:cytochrome P450 n=1 Tax=Mycobacterium sp. UM_CSW TaxID=1370119 RepID=UPI000416E250|nr:cytochrome P450 [Mycobacterium sp. UM_CSW]
MTQLQTAAGPPARTDLPEARIHRLRDWARSLRVGLDPERYFRRCADRRDPFVVVFPGLGPVHFVATAQGARQLLTTPRETLCAPTPNPIEPIVGPDSVILTSGEHHRRQRRLLSPAFHGAQLRRRADAIAGAVLAEVESWRPGDRVALHRTTQAITLRIIVETVLGVDHERIDEYTGVVSALMNANTASLLLVPALRRSFAGLGPWARLVRLRAEFQRMLTGQMNHGRSCPGDDAVLGNLLRENDHSRLGLDDDDLQQQLRTMVIAGHDTTAAALAWALYHIHRDTGVRARLVDELAAGPAPHEMPELPYLSAVIKETLRMHPAVPIVLRKLIEPQSIGSVRYRAGDIVGIALPAIHFSADLWDDPYRFDPDRFLVDNPTPFEYLPFGGGHRRCLGAAFASHEMAVAVGTIMRSAELTMPRRERRRHPPRSVPRGIAVVPRRDVKLVVSRTASAAGATRRRRR